MGGRRWRCDLLEMLVPVCGLWLFGWCCCGCELGVGLLLRGCEWLYTFCRPRGANFCVSLAGPCTTEGLQGAGEVETRPVRCRARGQLKEVKGSVEPNGIAGSSKAAVCRTYVPVKTRVCCSRSEQAAVCLAWSCSLDAVTTRAGVVQDLGDFLTGVQPAVLANEVSDQGEVVGSRGTERVGRRPSKQRVRGHLHVDFRRWMGVRRVRERCLT